MYQKRVFEFEIPVPEVGKVYWVVDADFKVRASICLACSIRDHQVGEQYVHMMTLDTDPGLAIFDTKAAAKAQARRLLMREITAKRETIKSMSANIARLKETEDKLAAQLSALENSNDENLGRIYLQDSVERGICPICDRCHTLNREKHFLFDSIVCKHCGFHMDETE